MAGHVTSETIFEVQHTALASNSHNDEAEYQRYSHYNGASHGTSDVSIGSSSSDQPPLHNVNSIPRVQQTRPRGRSLLEEIAGAAGHSGSSEGTSASSRQRPSALARALRYDPNTGQLMTRRQSRRERHSSTHHTIHEAPVLEQTQSPDLEQYHSYMESLHSNSTTSSQFESVETPTFVPDGLPSPPLVLSSPVEIPDSFLSRMAHQDPRSPSHESVGSLRRSGRRGTNRVGSTSASPAGTFLSQWSRDEYFTPSEPDEEGQEIGDNGEYIIGRQIGFGGFSVVKEAFTIEDNERIRRAVKIVRKQLAGSTEHMNEEVQNGFEHEVSIWRCLKHPYILPLIAVFNSDFATFCITKYNSGGTLFDLVRRQRRSRASDINLLTSASQNPKKLLPFSHMKRYIYQVASALRYLHEDMHIVHRDVKLENCLLDTDAPLSGSISSLSLSASVTSIASMVSDNTDEGHPKSPLLPGNILLCDFGMADFVTREDREVFLPSSSHSSDGSQDGTSNPHDPHNIGPGPTSANVTTSVNIAGSLQYASPESIQASEPIYETSIDIWAFGVLCYTLLTGNLPFTHGLAAKVQQKITEGEWDAFNLYESVKIAAGMEQDDSASNTKEADNALKFITGCLDMDPQTRWDIGKILACEFLERGAELYEKEE